MFGGRLGRDLRDCLHQAQDLEELALTTIAHARLQKMAKVLEYLGQIPALQWRRLIERIRLRLDQRQIMQWVGNEHALAIGSRVPGDLLPATQDHDLLDEALHHDLLELVGRRRRIVIAAIAYQGGGGDPRRPLLARLKRHRRQLAEGCGVGGQAHADCLGMTPGALRLPPASISWALNTS